MNNKMTINAYLFKSTLYANGLIAPIKRHVVAEGKTKQDPYMCCLQETPDQKTHIESKAMEKDIA